MRKIREKEKRKVEGNFIRLVACFHRASPPSPPPPWLAPPPWLQLRHLSPQASDLLYGGMDLVYHMLLLPTPGFAVAGEDFNNSGIGFRVLLPAGLEVAKLLLSLEQLEMEG